MRCSKAVRETNTDDVSTSIAPDRGRLGLEIKRSRNSTREGGETRADVTSLVPASPDLGMTTRISRTASASSVLIYASRREIKAITTAMMMTPNSRKKV